MADRAYFGKMKMLLHCKPYIIPFRAYIVVALVFLVFGPGCGLRYTVPKDLIRRLPKSSRKSVFQARTVVTIAIDKKSSVRRKIASTRREIERTKERIEDLQAKRSRTPARKRASLDLEIAMLKAKLDFLDEKIDFLEFKLKKAAKELLLAKARFELSKAKLIKKHAIKFSGDIGDFEDQVKDLEEDARDYKKELDERQKELKAEEKQWLAVKEKYYASVGETSRGWWTEQEQEGPASEGEKVIENKGNPPKQPGGVSETEKPVDRILKKRKAIIRDDFRLAFRFGDKASFLLDEKNPKMSLMLWTLDLEADYFIHPNFPIFISFNPGIGQSLRKGEKDEKITFLPIMIGMRYQDAEGIALPYVGVCFGSQVVFGDRETKTGIGFRTKLNFGIDVRVTRTWSINLEAGVSYSQVQLEYHKETDYSEPKRTRKTFNMLDGYITAGAAVRF